MFYAFYASFICRSGTRTPLTGYTCTTDINIRLKLSSFQSFSPTLPFQGIGRTLVIFRLWRHLGTVCGGVNLFAFVNRRSYKCKQRRHCGTPTDRPITGPDKLRGRTTKYSAREPDRRSLIHPEVRRCLRRTRVADQGEAGGNRIGPCIRLLSPLGGRWEAVVDPVSLGAIDFFSSFFSFIIITIVIFFKVSGARMTRQSDLVELQLMFPVERGRIARKVGSQHFDPTVPAENGRIEVLLRFTMGIERFWDSCLNDFPMLLAIRFAMFHLQQLKWGLGGSMCVDLTLAWS